MDRPDRQGGKEDAVKTADLKAGKDYLAKIGYSTYKVTVTEAALYTDQLVSEVKEVTELVDPKTPFDPLTGKKNPKVKETRKVTEWVTKRVPGFKPRKSYSWRRGDDTAGVPVKNVTSTFMVGRNNARTEDDRIRLVRPQDIIQTWESHLEAQKKNEEYEVKRKALIADFNARVQALPEDLGASAAKMYGTYATSTSKVEVDLEALEKLVEEFE